jgi:uncharacterized protein YtpQ (UPF0354 family)
MGQRLVEKFLDIDLNPDEGETISVVNNMVLGELRPCEDPELALRTETYCPRGILETLGVVVGEVMRRRDPDRVRWVEPPESISGSYPALELSIEGGEHCFIFPVDRLFHCYKEGQDRDLLTYDAVIEQTLSAGQPELPDTFEELSDQIFPVLKPANWKSREDVESVSLLSDGPLGTPRIVVVADHPKRIAFLIKSKMRQWNVTYDELVGRACANLARRSLRMEAHLEELDIESGLLVFRLDYEDYFNASRALLSDSLYVAARQRMPGVERFFVAVPNRDHLLLTAAVEGEDFSQFQGLVRWFHERQPAPLSSLCFQLDERGLFGHRACES